MMQYQKANHNFIPKENTEAQSNEIDENINIKEDTLELSMTENSSLKEENKKLQMEIAGLKNRLEELELLLVRKDNEVSSLIKEYNEYIEFQNNPNEFKELKANINEVDTMKNQITSLSEENENLKNQVESYKTHIQYLYLILLILAII